MHEAINLIGRVFIHMRPFIGLIGRVSADW